MNLIETIRAGLTSDSAQTANILRQARVLAHEYRSPELREWVVFELDGYTDASKVPSYRQFILPLLGTFHGPLQRRMSGVTITAMGLPEPAKEMAETLTIFDGVAALEDMLASGETRFHRTLMPEITLLLRETTKMTGRMVLFEAYQELPRYLITGILDNVKNRLLEFVLDLQARNVTPEGVNSGDVEPDVVRNAVSINIYGNNNTVAAGENIGLEVNPIRAGDLSSLVEHLRAHDVGDEDLRELRNAIESEPQTSVGQFGPKVNSWIGQMTTKALSGVWRAGVEQAPALIVQAIQRYYGS